MKNRPLLSVCLMVLCIIASMVVWGRERFIKELRPSPIERYAAEGDNITICGKIYRQEQKENCRMIYLKENSIYSIFSWWQAANLRTVRIDGRNCRIEAACFFTAELF